MGFPHQLSYMLLLAGTGPTGWGDIRYAVKAAAASF
jgi:hypothetical protein